MAGNMEKDRHAASQRVWELERLRLRREIVCLRAEIERMNEERRIWLRRLGLPEEVR